MFSVAKTHIENLAATFKVFYTGSIYAFVENIPDDYTPWIVYYII